MTEFPQTAEAIRKILESHKLSVAQLASKVGLDRTFLNRCANGEKKPGPLACVLLATLAPGAADRDLFISTSGLDHEQLARIAETAGASEAPILSGDERQLLSWWRSPEKLMDRQLREFLKVWLSQQKTIPQTDRSVLEVLEPKDKNKAEYYIENRSWHTMLDVILESGDKAFIVGIQANLESWSQAITISRVSRRQLGGGNRDPEPSQSSSSDGLVEAQRAQKRAEQDAGKSKRRRKESA